MTDFLYLLHFDQPRHHARHYLGSSVILAQRLTQHATGDGACLTRALWEDDEPWQLAALFVPRRRCGKTIREYESAVKQRHNSTLYCPLCCGGKERIWSPPGTISYPVGVVRSEMLRNVTAARAALCIDAPNQPTLLEFLSGSYPLS